MQCDKTVPGESLLMLATVGEPITIQVDPQLHKILQCLKEDVRMPLSVNKLQLVSVETGAKASVNIAFKLGEKVAIQSTCLGEVIGFHFSLEGSTSLTDNESSIELLKKNTKEV